MSHSDIYVFLLSCHRLCLLCTCACLLCALLLSLCAMLCHVYVCCSPAVHIARMRFATSSITSDTIATCDTAVPVREIRYLHTQKHVRKGTGGAFICIWMTLLMLLPRWTCHDVYSYHLYSRCALSMMLTHANSVRTTRNETMKRGPA